MKDQTCKTEQVIMMFLKTCVYKFDLLEDQWRETGECDMWWGHGCRKLQKKKTIFGRTAAISRKNCFFPPRKKCKNNCYRGKARNGKKWCFLEIIHFFQCFTFSAFPKNVHVFFSFFGGERGELSIFSTFCWMGFFHDFFPVFWLNRSRKERVHLLHFGLKICWD